MVRQNDAESAGTRGRIENRGSAGKKANAEKFMDLDRGSVVLRRPGIRILRFAHGLRISTDLGGKLSLYGS